MAKASLRLQSVNGYQSGKQRPPLPEWPTLMARKAAQTQTRQTVQRARQVAVLRFRRSSRAAAKTANRHEEGKEPSFPDRYVSIAVEGRSGVKGGRGLNGREPARHEREVPVYDARLTLTPCRAEIGLAQRSTRPGPRQGLWKAREVPPSGPVSVKGAVALQPLKRP